MPVDSRRRMLEGVRVLDFGRVAAAPHSALILASLGAEVIKIERPVFGDDTRANPHHWPNGESAYFWQQNIGKKSVSLDLKHPEGRDVALRLIDEADVLIENFRPGTMEKLGLGWDTVSARNPRLVFCSISAYGQTGPDALKPGYGALAEARAGIPDIVGEPDGPPMPSPIAMPDFAAAGQAFGAICAALYSRERTGRGERLDISLLDCAVEMHDWAVQLYQASGGAHIMRRRGRFDRSIVPWGYFQTTDGWIALIVSNDRFWVKLAHLMNRPDLADDERFATVAARARNSDEVYRLLAEWIATRDPEELLATLQAADIPAEPVARVQEPADPQLRARGMFVTVQHPELGEITVLNTAVRATTSDTGVSGFAPRLGEHNRELLEGLLSMPVSRIEELTRSGVLYGDRSREEVADA